VRMRRCTLSFAGETEGTRPFRVCVWICSVARPQVLEGQGGDWARSSSAWLFEPHARWTDL